MIQSRRKLVLWLLALSLVPAFAWAGVRRAAKPSGKTAQTRHSAAHTKTRRRTSKRSHRYSRTSHSRRYTHRRSRRSRSRRRTAGLEIPSQRATAIQQALIQSGDLQGQPTGHWDADTRSAMKKYQQANGFASTGLPDAKSLMKMGLGPHPLPKDVDPMAQARPAGTPPPASASKPKSTPPPENE